MLTLVTMQGRTLKRGNTWTFVVDLPPLDGRRRQRQKGGFRTRKAAEAALAEQITDIQKGTILEPDRQQLGDFLERWLADVSPSLGPSTISLYRLAITKWINPRIGKVRLLDLTPGNLQRLYTELSGTGLSARSVKLAHSLLNRSLDQAADWRLIGRNPAAAKLTLPRDDRKVSAHWTAEEARTFLDETAASRHFPMWAVFLSTGLRRGEVLGLLWEDAGLETGVLRVTRALVAVDGVATISTPKTNASRRVLYLSDTTMAALRQRKADQEAERDKAGTAWEESGLVFTTRLGGLIHPQNLRRAFETAQKHAGVRRIRLHDLRHSFASIAMEAGVHPKLVQEMLGHTSANLSMDLYTHTTPGAHREAINVVGDVLNGGSGSRLVPRR